MNKIGKTSLPKQIADDIELQIRNGKYSIGEKLPTEPELVELYGVSRNTLREAIQSLSNSGILETRQGDGTYVVAKERLQVEFFNVLGSTSSKDVLEVRNMLENCVVISAINNATPEDIKIIKHYLELRKHTRESIRENTQADLDFHTAIAKSTHNDLLISLYKYVAEYFSQFIYDKIYRKTQNQTYIDEIHDLLFAALKEKNIKLAQECIKKIIEI